MMPYQDEEIADLNRELQIACNLLRQAAAALLLSAYSDEVELARNIKEFLAREEDQ